MDTQCRICIEQTAKCTSLNSKIQDFSNVSFFDFLNKCTTLNAREGDSLPQSLCSACANAMRTFYSFMKLAEKSDLILREALRHLNAEGRYNDRREIPCGQIAITKKIEEESEDFNQGDSFHCQLSGNLTGSSLYILDIVKEEPRLSENTSIVAVKDAEIVKNESNFIYPESSIEESDNVLSRRDGRRLAINYTELVDSEDDVPIDSLKSRLYKNVDETDSQSKVHKGIRHKCNQCDKEFTHINALRRHIKWHANPKPFKCENCGKPLCSKRDHARHINICKRRSTPHQLKESENNCGHKCDHCDKEFQSIYNLHKHMRCHKNAKPFKCESCGKSFRRKDRCIKHNVICKRRSKKPQQLKTPELKKSETDCGICGKAFSRKDYLVVHMKNHLGITTKCNICGKEFKHGNSLSNHMKMHNNPKRFNCEVCGKSLSSYHSRHMETCKPPGEPLIKTKFDCELCGKKFTTKYYLSTHMDSHKGIIKKCNQCGKGFKPGNSFSRHMRWHKNPRPFNCEYCGKSLARRPSYEKHMKICKQQQTAAIENSAFTHS